MLTAQEIARRLVEWYDEDLSDEELDPLITECRELLKLKPDPNGSLIAALMANETEAVAAITEAVREEMHRLRHIPTRYFIAGVDPIAGTKEQKQAARDALLKLDSELDSKGFIDLDKDGEPCCLSGNPPAYVPKKIEALADCPSCGGAGEVHSHNPICPTCRGKKKVTQEVHDRALASERQIEATIPRTTGDYQ